jgi:hypothetical protein
MNLMLACSLVINVALVTALYWTGRHADREMMSLLAESANEQIAVQQRVLEDLDSKERNRIEALTTWLKANIDAQSRLRYKADTGEK